MKTALRSINQSLNPFFLFITWEFFNSQLLSLKEFFNSQLLSLKEFFNSQLLRFCSHPNSRINSDTLYSIYPECHCTRRDMKLNPPICTTAYDKLTLTPPTLNR